MIKEGHGVGVALREKGRSIQNNALQRPSVHRAVNASETPVLIFNTKKWSVIKKKLYTTIKQGSDGLTGGSLWG